DFLRSVLQLAVRFDHFTRGRRVDLADGLDRLHRPKGFSGFDLRSGLRQLDEDHVTEFLLRIVSDADRGKIALHLVPFVLFAVAVSLRICHQVAPWTHFDSFRIRVAPPLFSAACKMASEPPAPCTSARESPRTKPCRERKTRAAHK